MNKKGDNKIKIPWYRRNIRLGGEDIGEIPPLSLPPMPPITPRPRPKVEPVRQPVRQPATQPATQPVRVPFLQPDFQPNPFPNPFPNPLPFPNPFPVPLPERKPDNRNPAPQGNPAPAPAPQLPAFPVLSPMFTDPNYDWAKHWEEVAKQLPEPAPAPEKKNPAQQALESILKPIVWLFVANEVKNQYIKVTVTDPIYNKMLEQPVLGNVLREAEKANMDAETVGTILANFDWENGDYKELEKQLAIGVGAAGAARLMVFIIGRKVVFRL